MMSGYPDGRPAAPHRPRAYGVVARDGGWCVTLDGCATRPFKDREAAARIARVLTNDPGTGVMRHADAGYQIAIDCAKEQGLNLPMIG